VLTDLRMPDLDGIGLYREVNRTQPQLAQRMIFVSGNGGEPRYQRFLVGLEDRNLAKPFDVGQLTRLVRTRLGLATGRQAKAQGSVPTPASPSSGTACRTV